MESIRIQRQDYPTRGSYVGTLHGVHGIARLNYKRERPDLLIAERTETSDSLREHGVTGALIARMVEDARTDRVKIYALCPYVDDHRRAHPEWSDVFVTL
ncbi:MAG TPA: N-acetyltransferase [Burkholderiales bacterium]|jgi:predicted GNAT family acetyltransferase|nr:N-acetyltransferase [Burkholderiales bacterium]